MANTIQLRRSATANAVPTTAQLALGELAINTYDGKLYLKKNVSGVESIVEVTGGSAGGGGGASVTISENPPSSPSVGDLWWDNVSGQLKIYYVGPENSYWVEASTNVTAPVTLQETFLSVSENTVLTTNYTFINATNTITLTLPTVGVITGFKIYIRNAGVGQITLIGTINGMANITLGETNSVIGLVATSSGWVIF